MQNEINVLVEAPSRPSAVMPDTSSMQFRRLIQAIDAPRPPCDSRDWSANPSYTQVRLPYWHICRQRYKNAVVAYERQFQHELAQLQAAQTTAYDCVRLNAHLAITSYWPPLHTHAQQLATARTFYRLTRRQQERLDVIMTTRIM